MKHSENNDHDNPYDENENLELFDPEDPSFFEDDDEPIPQPHRKWIRKTIVFLVAIALFANLLAALPSIYNLQAIQFLKKNSILSTSEHIQKYKQAIVVVNAKDRKGTGFNIAADGLIITNHHVIENEKVAIITFPNRPTYLADTILSDPAIDIAILQIRDRDLNLPLLEIESNTQWRVGAPVYVIGNPLFFNQIANEGTILGLTALRNWDQPVMMIQAPIYNGNSGSPIINEAGKVISVVFATTTVNLEGQTEKVGLAIPIEYVQKHLESLNKDQP